MNESCFLGLKEQLLQHFEHSPGSKLWVIEVANALNGNCAEKSVIYAMGQLFDIEYKTDLVTFQLVYRFSFLLVYLFLFTFYCYFSLLFIQKR